MIQTNQPTPSPVYRKTKEADIFNFINEGSKEEKDTSLQEDEDKKYFEDDLLWERVKKSRFVNRMIYIWEYYICINLTKLIYKENIKINVDGNNMKIENNRIYR